MNVDIQYPPSNGHQALELLEKCDHVWEHHKRHVEHDDSWVHHWTCKKCGVVQK